MLFRSSQLHAADLRLGIIGTDTSHVIAFAKALNDPAAPDHVAGARIAAYKEGSPELKESGSRIGKSKAGSGAAYRAELAAP